jgi:hypothetical protein
MTDIQNSAKTFAFPNGQESYKHLYLSLGVAIKANVPVILWGAPGQGKTSVIKHFAEKSERKLEIILASIREPQDFIGLPALVDGEMRFMPPEWAKRLAAEADGGILFADEVNTAPPSVQAALLRVCLEKVAGDFDLGLETRIVAAANPPEIAADGWDLAPPLANRFCHLDWNLPASVVAQGLAGAWPTYELPDTDEAQIADHLENEKLLVAGFLTAQGHRVTVMPDSSTDQGRAFPTPRSWETVTKVSGMVSALQLPEEIRYLLVNGCIGEPAASEYLAYRENQDLPNPEDIIANPQMTLPTRPDQLYMLTGSVMRALHNNFSPARWEKVGEFIKRLFQDNHPDVAMALNMNWSKLTPAGTPIDRGILREISPFVQLMQ